MKYPDAEAWGHRCNGQVVSVDGRPFLVHHFESGNGTVLAYGSYSFSYVLETDRISRGEREAVDAMSPSFDYKTPLMGWFNYSPEHACYSFRRMQRDWRQGLRPTGVGTFSPQGTVYPELVVLNSKHLQECWHPSFTPLTPETIEKVQTSEVHGASRAIHRLIGIGKDTLYHRSARAGTITDAGEIILKKEHRFLIDMLQRIASPEVVIGTEAA